MSRPSDFEITACAKGYQGRKLKSGLPLKFRLSPIHSADKLALEFHLCLAVHHCEFAADGSFFW